MKGHLPTWFAILVWIAIVAFGVSLYVGKYGLAAFIFGALIIIYLDWILTIQAALLTQAEKMSKKLNGCD
jgi:hypothetical protein